MTEKVLPPMRPVVLRTKPWDRPRKWESQKYSFHQIRSVIGIPSSELLAKEFARVLKKNSGEQDFLAQYGDDAFVILSEGPEEQLTEIAGHLLQAIKADIRGIRYTHSGQQRRSLIRL